ncbi:MAG: hypothetical protein ACYTDU_03240 [Planctomycetota bacterium]|jgi:hypothetical protein
MPPRLLCGALLLALLQIVGCAVPRQLEDKPEVAGGWKPTVGTYAAEAGKLYLFT